MLINVADQRRVLEYKDEEQTKSFPTNPEAQKIG